MEVGAGAGMRQCDDFQAAEITPLSALKLAEIYSEAGLPKGAFNVVQGDGRVGRMLSLHPQIAKVSLTGEAGTGKKVMADAASTLKHVTFELGGKSPLIIFADADLESAISAALSANFFSSGQVCSNATRVFVEDSICDEFIAKIKPRVEAMKLGDPFDSATQVGPLISRGHWEKVMSYIHSAHASGATHIVGGERPGNPELEKGNYVTPAIFSDCQDDMKFVREEIFGPVMSVLRFQSGRGSFKARQCNRLRLIGGGLHARFCARPQSRQSDSSGNSLDKRLQHNAAGSSIWRGKAFGSRPRKRNANH